jgi:PAS domain S-box-containing protein
MEYDFLNNLQFDLGAMEHLFNPLSTTGILITDFLGSILYANPFFEKITGYDTEDIVGENYYVLHSQQDNPTFYHDIWENLRKNSFWTGEIRDDVSSFWVSIYKVFDINGNSYFIFFYNIFFEKGGMN